MARRKIGIVHTKADGTSEIDYWDAKIVGKAREELKNIPEHTTVEIIGNAFTGYDKENHKNHPYILVNILKIAEKHKEPEEEY